MAAASPPLLQLLRCACAAQKADKCRGALQVANGESEVASSSGELGSKSNVADHGGMLAEALGLQLDNVFGEGCA